MSRSKIATLAGVIAAALSSAAPAEDTGLYLGIGVGASRLDPESSTRAIATLDENDVGFHALAGYDINRWLSAEGYVADLGSAQIGFLGRDIGDVDYRLYGVRAVGYLWSARGGVLRNGGDGTGRQGPSLYLAAGVGGLDTESSLAVRTENRAHVSFAAGVEMGLPRGVALRAEIAGYDTDARYASVTVLKRFGARDVEAAPTRKDAATDPVAPPVAVAQDVPEPEMQTMFRPIVPPYLYFGFDDAALSAESVEKLEAFAEQVVASGLDVEIDGHTDSVGTEGYNVGLSEQRADAVRDVLLRAGMEPARLSIVGVGEARPLESNATPEGRAVNRRAGFTLR